MSKTTKTKRGIRRFCRDCEELRSDVTPDSMLCERCEERYVYCAVCNDWQLDESGSGCRHIQWVNGIGHAGCGWVEDQADTHLESFEAVLAAIGRENACKMREALIAHTFNLQFCGSLLGGTRVHCYVGPSGFRGGSDIGHAFTDALEAAGAPEDLEEQMALGVAWLNSLEPSDKNDPGSVDADDLTVRWIDAWLAKQSAPRAAG